MQDINTSTIMCDSGKRSNIYNDTYKGNQFHCETDIRVEEKAVQSVLQVKSVDPFTKIEASKEKITIRKKKTKVVEKTVEPKVTEITETIQKAILQEMETNKISESDFTDTEKDVLSHLGDYIEEPYSIIESYFAGQHLERLVRHQIESYNHFINYQIQRTIQMFNPVVIHSENDYIEDKQQYMLEVSIDFENFKLYPPQIHENNGATKVMLPQEAKLRNFTYSSTMTVDLHIKYIIKNNENMDTPKIITKILPKINIGKIPIMIKSSICVLTQNNFISSNFTGECAMDCGGYFIIKGSEKTVLGQERAAENRVYCFDGKNTTKWNWTAEIKSVPDFKCISPKQIEMMIANKNNGFGNGIYITIPRIKQPIELFVLFRALDVLTDKQICEYILLDTADEKYTVLLQCLQASIIDANKYMTREDALRHITSMVAYTPINMDKETGSRKKREFTLEVLNNDLFPHCKTFQQKLYLIGYMAKKLLQTSLGWLSPDDRDSYLNKRIELTGTLLNNLFRNYFNKLVKEMQKQIVREINNGSWHSKEDYENIINMTNIYKIMKSTTIENGIARALSTGDFSIKQANSSKVGVAQVLNRLTYVSSLSHLRRINTPLEKSGELIAPRKLHNTTWGYLCLAGDTEVLSANCTDSRPIKDIVDGMRVNTVNREVLEDEPSPVHSCFSKMPDKLYEITTISGRKIKATADHPFLTKMENGTYEMKKVSELRENDKVIIRHSVKNIPDTNTTILIIREEDILEKYRQPLINKGFLNTAIPVPKLRLIARILGIMLSVNPDYYDKDEFDAFIQAHIELIGFNVDPEEYDNYELFGYFLKVAVNGSGANYSEKLGLPAWILNGELSIKREFLSAFHSNECTATGEDSCICYSESQPYKPQLKTIVSLPNDISMVITLAHVMSQVSDIYREFDINCKFTVNTVYDGDVKKKIFYIDFDKNTENLLRYADIMNYTNSDRKRAYSAAAIEHLKIKQFNKTKYTNEYIKDNFIDINILENGCMAVPIASIKEVEPEMVYDFTTVCDNHSFVANSFVVSNCPVETPEGQSIGIVKNISYMAHISIPTNSSSLYEYVQKEIIPIDNVPSTELNGKVKVFINGAWTGVTDNPHELYSSLKEKKYRGIINIYTSIIFDYKMMEIRVCNDGGRLLRPVLRVVDNKALLTKEIVEKIVSKEYTWNDLLTSCKLSESVIEYIDPDEQNLAMIALKTKDGYVQENKGKINYTHCEIHPSTIFGVLGSCIPFPEHNQSPRNCYQCCMAKQAIGVYALNYDQRMDKTAHVLNYPSRPLVDTRLMNFIHLNRVPSGCQVHVAIMTHTGYNQEDSLLINQGSIDRGMFSSTVYHTEKDEDKNIIRDEIIRCKPDTTKTRCIKFGNYGKLNQNGFINENELVENRDIIIAKIIPIKENRNDPTKTIKYEDQSKSFRTTEEAYIDKNFTGRNGDGYNFAKVRVRNFRKPVLGDKFASRSAQKGTVGNIIPECDMPFTKDGLRPDIILNPHAIPSRMTIAQLKETLLGKVLLELGLFGDGTSFGTLDINTITRELQKQGYESYGNEVMYNGLTGEQMETNIFIGPVFYQRLKHMVNDKQHSRAIGPMVNLTRQPAEGRSRDGGFRIGEMERDVMLAHGMTKFCRERLYDASDKYSVHVCKKCGMIASYNDGKKNKMYINSDYTVYLCKTCDNTTDFALVEIPYAYKLLSQELQTINIVPRIITA